MIFMKMSNHDGVEPSYPVIPQVGRNYRLPHICHPLYAAGASEGDDGIVLCAVGIGHDHPEALLLRLFQEDVGLAGAFHPDLVPYQARIREEVLNGITGDPYKAAWSILEDLRREGWILPLSSTLT